MDTEKIIKDILQYLVDQTKSPTSRELVAHFKNKYSHNEIKHQITLLTKLKAIWLYQYQITITIIITPLGHELLQQLTKTDYGNSSNRI
jgi:hypothetical protein